MVTSTITLVGCQKTPTRFLPARLTPVLPPMAASTAARRVVGTCTDFHPTKPGAGDESGEIGHRPSADTDDGVVATEAEPGESLVDRAGDNQGLGLLPIRETDHLYLDALVSQMPRHFEGDVGGTGLGDQGHPFAVGSCRKDRVGQPRPTTSSVLPATIKASKRQPPGRPERPDR